MAIERNCAMLLLKAHQEGVPFGRSLMLGHQSLALSADGYQSFHRIAKATPELPQPAYADSLFRALGARQVDVMDFSDYEGANLLHDLNQPVPDEFKGAFDAVVDGGTLEHVFNFPVAIRNCMEMVRPGGSFFSATIPNNWCGHGFYQFSPELFFRILSPDNGFRVAGMFLAELDGSRWWSVQDPAAVRSRVELVNDHPVFLLIHAVREKCTPIFQRTPQQSDYVTAWSGPRGNAGGSGWKHSLQRLPLIRSLAEARRRRRERRWASVSNSDFYIPFDPGFRL